MTSGRYVGARHLVNSSQRSRFRVPPSTKTWTISGEKALGGMVRCLAPSLSFAPAVVMIVPVMVMKISATCGVAVR